MTKISPMFGRVPAPAVVPNLGVPTNSVICLSGPSNGNPINAGRGNFFCPINSGSPVGGGGGGDDSYTIVQNRWNRILPKLVELGCEPNDIEQVEHAVWYAAQAFEGLFRKSGRHAIEHSLDVLEVLVFELRIIEKDTLIAGVLHDTKEDTSVSLEKIGRDFGDRVKNLIDALTKFPKTHFAVQSVRFEKNRERLFSLMIKDVRIALIKLSDRLSNMLTLDGINDQRDRERIAFETLEYFVPLANVLGIWQLKRPLEDLSFMRLNPAHYDMIRSHLDNTSDQREKMVSMVEEELRSMLSNEGINVIRFAVKPRTVYSLYCEMRALAKRSDFKGSTRQLINLLARTRPLLDQDTFNIVVESVNNCFSSRQALMKTSHLTIYSIDDFITSPKLNFYQSLNMTLSLKECGLIRVKIRTEEMEAVNDRGIAAVVFERGQDLPEYWGGLLELWQAGIDESSQINKDLKRYLRPIMMFTPKNKPIVLQKGASALDFAFAVHTDIGLNATGAIINGKTAQLLDTPEDGSVIEIVTEKGSPKPKRDLWIRLIPLLNGEARRKIKRFLEKRPAGENINFGKKHMDELFEKHFGYKLSSIDEADENYARPMKEALANISSQVKHHYVDPMTSRERRITELLDLYWYIGTLSLDSEVVLREFSKAFKKR